MLIPESSNEIISSGMTPTVRPYRTSLSAACSNSRASGISLVVVCGMSAVCIEDDQRDVMAVTPADGPC